MVLAISLAPKFEYNPRVYYSVKRRKFIIYKAIIAVACYYVAAIGEEN
jgi:hypothetical protein